MPAVDPTSSKTTGYHIFLQPKGMLARNLSNTIQSLAEEFSGPVFDPHVTLLARISVKDEEMLIAQTEKLAPREPSIVGPLRSTMSQGTQSILSWSEIEVKQRLYPCFAGEYCGVAVFSGGFERFRLPPDLDTSP